MTENSSASENTALVPDLIGLDLVDANALAHASGVTVVPAQPSEDLPVTGVVVSQEPLAGAEVAQAFPVRITVGEGGREVDHAPLTGPPV